MNKIQKEWGRERDKGIYTINNFINEEIMQRMTETMKDGDGWEETGCMDEWMFKAGEDGKWTCCK